MGKKAEIEVSVAEVMDYSRITGYFMPTLKTVAERKFTAEVAKKGGLTVSPNELQRASDVFRHMNGLRSAKATETWLRFHGITPEAYEGFLEMNVLISKFKDKLEADADKSKYLAHGDVKATVRSLVYEDWLRKNFK